MSIMTEMAYKVDFISSSIVAVCWILSEMGFLILFFDVSGFKNIIGFDKYDLLLVLSFSQIIMSLVFFITPGRVLKSVTDQILAGGLDVFLIKPINSMFLVFNQFVTMREGYLMLVYGIISLPILFIWKNWEFGVDGWLQILFVIVHSIILITLMYRVSLLLNFFWPRFDVLTRFLDSMLAVYRFPKDIYPGLLKTFLYFVIPIFAALNPIYNVINHTFDWRMVLQLVIIDLVFVLLVMVMWNKGLRNYQSAN